MTLPYVWYRTSVWIPLGVAVNNFWGFLVIFWKVPAIVRPAAYRAKLEPPLGRPHLPLFSCELFSNRFFFFFSSWLLLHERWQPGCWWFFSVHLIPFFFFFFFLLFFFFPHTATPQSPAHTSETSAERLALACERVHADNAMHYVSTAFVWNAAAVILASL